MPYFAAVDCPDMGSINATQVGVGSGPVEAAALLVLVGGIALTILWLRALYS